MSDAVPLVGGALAMLEALAVSSFFLLSLFIGFCVLLGLPRLRARRRRGRVVHSLDEALGRPQRYLHAGDPRGPADQLHTPELLRTEGRSGQ